MDSDLVDFLCGSTDSAIDFSGSADLQTLIHPPPYIYHVLLYNRMMVILIFLRYKEVEYYDFQHPPKDVLSGGPVVGHFTQVQNYEIMNFI